MNGFLRRLEAGVVVADAEAMQALGREFSAHFPVDAALALHGDLGAGKTTFVKGLAAGWGVLETVTSPTFAIYAIHEGATRQLVHMDAYRLDGPGAFESLMIDEFLRSPWCLALEWPERLGWALPQPAWHLWIEVVGEGRRVRLTSSR